MLSTAYIGLGSNLGDRVQNIIDARQRLYELVGKNRGRSSSLYLSSPVGSCESAEKQDDYLNCVLQLEVELSAINFFSAMQKIEADLGRTRDPSNQYAARIIDCDLLLFGNEVVSSPELIVPHPRMVHRLFVLKPLLELSSDLIIDGLGKLTELLENGDFSDQQIYRLGS